MRFFIFIIVLAVTLGTATVVYLNVLESNRPAEPVTVRQVDELRALIEQGDITAITRVAELYRTGTGGVAHDPAKARRLFEAAAKKGSGDAQYALATMLETGEGGRADPHAAVRWYRMAANYGHRADALFAMGRLYDSGIGLDHDPVRAREFYARAAAKGNAPAQYLMGIAHEQGIDGTPDLLEACRWYTLAAENPIAVRAVNERYKPTQAAARVNAKLNNWQRGECQKRAAATWAGYR